MSGWNWNSGWKMDDWKNVTQKHPEVLDILNGEEKSKVLLHELIFAMLKEKGSEIDAWDIATYLDSTCGFLFAAKLRELWFAWAMEKDELGNRKRQSQMHKILDMLNM